MSRESRPPARGSPFASPCPGEAIVESGLEGMAHAVRAHPRTRAGFTSDRHRCCAMQHFATCNGTALQFSSLPLCGAFLVALQRLLHGLCYAGSHPWLHGQQHSYSSCLFRRAFLHHSSACAARSNQNPHSHRGSGAVCATLHGSSGADADADARSTILAHAHAHTHAQAHASSCAARLGLQLNW